MSEPTTIPDRFAAVARSEAGRIALVQDDREVTYGELDELSAALAARLRAAGVDVEGRVGVHLPRSIDLVIALLAVLRSGGAYVVLPPEYPADRLRYLVDDAQIGLIVTTQSLQEEAARLGPTLTVEGDGDPDDDTPSPGRAGLSGDNLAYVIYTSGTTGRPKGVGVTHRNLLGLVRGQAYMGFAPGETFLQLSPGSFDASAFETWGALLNGARLVVAAPSYQAIEELPAVLQEHEVTNLLLTPPLFHELIRHRLDAFAGVRRLVVGGEAMSVSDALVYARDAAARGAGFANVYGPTETTTLVTCHELAVPPVEVESIPIGRPIANAAVYLLDERFHPVPVGTTGEIHIGGSCVTRGYLGRPGETARRFRPDPFSPVPGARMYASGDLGTLRADGEIEFLGRDDEQVKIRGHRVEPQEIERVMLGHPGVRAAAVVARHTEGGTGRLIAFLVPDGARTESLVAEVTALLSAELPAYLLPSTIQMLDALPLSTSGKVDRRALCDLPTSGESVETAEGEHAGGETVVDDPGPGMTQDQQVLAGIWSQILGIEQVGLDDNFFGLGGDSILAIRTVADAETHGIRIALTDLFQNPTIRHVCPPAPDVPTVPAPPEVPVPATPSAAVPLLGEADRLLVPDDVVKAYPATQMQLGLVFESMMNGALYHDVISRRLSARWDEAALRQALDLVSARHDALRTRFSLGRFSVPMQLVGRQPAVPLAVSDARGASGTELAGRLAADRADAGLPFDPESGPLLRVLATVIDDDTFQLTYGFHHAVMDGWSESVLVTELLTAYDALLSGTAPGPGLLPEVDLDYTEFIRLEQAAISSPRTREFWRTRCEHDPALLRPREAERTGERLRLRRVLSADVTSGLEKARAATGVPFKSLAVAAHLVALSTISDAGEPVTGLAVNGRPETAGGDRLIGLFLNVVPFGVPLNGPWDELVGRVFDAERAMMPHRRMPYPALRELSPGLIFDVSFNYVQFHLRSDLDLLTRVRVDDTTIHDMASHPLIVEVVQVSGGGGISVEMSADAGCWTAPELDEVMAAHCQAFASMAQDLSQNTSV